METKVTAKLVKAGSSLRNTKVINFLGNAFLKDVPDTYVIHPWFEGWIEYKGPRTKTTSGQADFIRLSRCAYIVRFLECDDVDLHFVVEDADNNNLTNMRYLSEGGPTRWFLDIVSTLNKIHSETEKSK